MWMNATELRQNGKINRTPPHSLKPEIPNGFGADHPPGWLNVPDLVTATTKLSKPTFSGQQSSGNSKALVYFTDSLVWRQTVSSRLRSVCSKRLRQLEASKRLRHFSVYVTETLYHRLTSLQSVFHFLTPRSFITNLPATRRGNRRSWSHRPSRTSLGR